MENASWKVRGNFLIDFKVLEFGFLRSIRCLCLDVKRFCTWKSWIIGLVIDKFCEYSSYGKLDHGEIGYMVL